MSLQHAAQHLASKGRGDDKVLVHMTRGEVKSLNDLAMAHGGQLTINPQTGLPEAGFLSAILPMVAGAGLMAVSGGTINPMTAGLIVGGLRTAQSGSLSKGIMAGFGAYGGANLGQTLALEGLNAPPPLPEAVESSRQVIAGGPQATAQQVLSNAPSTVGTISPVISGSAPGTVLPSMTPDYPGSANFINAEAANLSGLTAPAPVTQAQLNAANQGISDMNFGGDSGMGISGSAPYKYTAPDLKNLTTSERLAAMQKGFTPGNLGNFASKNIGSTAAMVAPLIPEQKQPPRREGDKDMGQRYSYSAGVAQPQPAPDVPSYDDMLTQQGNFGRQQNYYPNQQYTPISNEQAKNIYGYANGGMPIEQMSNQAMMGANTMYPMSNMATSSFATPYQTPQSTNMLANMVAPSGGGAVNAMSGEPNMQGTRMAEGGPADEDGFLAFVGRSFGVRPKKEEENPGLKYAFSPEQQQYVQQQASGGISDAGYNLGGYSDGGRLLRGPGDGVSDSIPAVIGKKQPARLADGEFVVPARIVSELGNGSTEAGARKLYAMMDRIQAARKKTVGKDKVAHNSRASKYLPA